MPGLYYTDIYIKEPKRDWYLFTSIYSEYIFSWFGILLHGYFKILVIFILYFLIIFFI